MKIKTIKRMLAMFCVNHVLAGTALFGLKRRLLRAAGCQIGKNSKIVGPIHSSATLIVGENCWIGRNLTVHGNGTVVIGDNCDLGPEVMFLTGGHSIGDRCRRAGAGEVYTITVGHGCWIGARATIGRNVTLGPGTVVAACGCVMADVPEHTLVGGVPARKIKELNHGA